MTRAAMLALAAGLLLPAVPVAAEDHRQMRAAERDLQSARAHLQAAVRDFQGHRKAAVEHVNKALDEIHAGLTAVEATEKRGQHTKGRPAGR